MRIYLFLRDENLFVFKGWEFIWFEGMRIYLMLRDKIYLIFRDENLFDLLGMRSPLRTWRLPVTGRAPRPTRWSSPPAPLTSRLGQLLLKIVLCTCHFTFALPKRTCTQETFDNSEFSPTGTFRLLSVSNFLVRQCGAILRMSDSRYWSDMFFC
jgi:hypothetical protein